MPIVEVREEVVELEVIVEHVEDEVEDSYSARDGHSEYGGPDEEEVPTLDVQVPETPARLRTPNFRLAWASLDEVDLQYEIGTRCCTFKQVPWMLKGLARAVFRLALEAAEESYDRNDARMQERAWKLFMLIPRMLLHNPWVQNAFQKKS